jgi:hypothetical protein
MTAGTWITMIVVMLFVWGGCGLAVVMIMNKEKTKSAAGPGGQA